MSECMFIVFVVCLIRRTDNINLTVYVANT